MCFICLINSPHHSIQFGMAETGTVATCPLHSSKSWATCRSYKIAGRRWQKSSVHGANKSLICAKSRSTSTVYYESVSILSGEILRLRERNGEREPERDLEGLRDT